MIKVYDGFMNFLKYANEVLKQPKIFIGENGYPEDEGIDNSVKKIAYHTVSKVILYKMIIILI